MHHTESNLIEIKDKIKNKIKLLSLNQYDPKLLPYQKHLMKKIYYHY